MKTCNNHGNKIVCTTGRAIVGNTDRSGFVVLVDRTGIKGFAKVRGSSRVLCTLNKEYYQPALPCLNHNDHADSSMPLKECSTAKQSSVASSKMQALQSGREAGPPWHFTQRHAIQNQLL